MPLDLPQSVRIQNARLQVVSLVLYILVSAIVVAQFAYFRQYGQLVPVEGSGDVFVHGTSNESHLVEYHQNKSRESFCRKPADFNYWYDQEGRLRYDNHSCIQPCAACGSGCNVGCVKLPELVFVETPASIVLTTQIQEKAVTPGKDEYINYFVSTVEALSVQLNFRLRVPSAPWFAVSASQQRWVSHSSYHDVRTAVLDSKGTLWKVIGPGQRCEFTVNELLQLAGHVDGSLDTPQVLAGRNYHPGSIPDGPVARISGVEILMKLLCGDAEVSAARIDLQVSSSSPVCILIVRDSPAWVVIQSAGRNASRSYRGVRVKVQMSGHQTSLSMNSIFLNIASSIVFFQLPRGIIFFIAIWCCGHVSAIYRHIVRRNFSIAAEAGAMTMRLLTHEVAFNELQSQSPEVLKHGVLSKAEVSHGLTHVMERRGRSLDVSEMQQMLDFCIDSVGNTFSGADNKENRTSVLSDMCDGIDHLGHEFQEAFGCGKPMKHFAESNIDLDKFASACSSMDPISFDSLIKLFDKDRRISFLERFFMPMRLRRCLEKSKSQGVSPEIPAVRTSMRSSVSTMQGDVGKLGTKVITTENALKDLGCQVRSLNEKMRDVEHTFEHEGGRRGRSCIVEDKVQNLNERVVALEQRMCKHENAQEHRDGPCNCTEGGQANSEEQGRRLKEASVAPECRLERHQEQQENTWKDPKVDENWAVSAPRPDIQSTTFESYVSLATLQTHLQEMYIHVDQRLSMIVNEIHSKVDRILQLQQNQPRHNWVSRTSSRDRGLDGPETPPLMHRYPGFAVSGEVVHPGLPIVCEPEFGRRAMSDRPDMLSPGSPASTAYDMSLRSLCLAKSGIYHLQGPPQEPQSPIISSRV